MSVGDDKYLYFNFQHQHLREMGVVPCHLPTVTRPCQPPAVELETVQESVEPIQEPLQEPVESGQ